MRACFPSGSLTWPSRAVPLAATLRRKGLPRRPACVVMSVHGSYKSSTVHAPIHTPVQGVKDNDIVSLDHDRPLQPQRFRLSRISSPCDVPVSQDTLALRRDAGARSLVHMAWWRLGGKREGKGLRADWWSDYLRWRRSSILLGSSTHQPFYRRKFPRHDWRACIRDFRRRTHGVERQRED